MRRGVRGARNALSIVPTRNFRKPSPAPAADIRGVGQSVECVEYPSRALPITSPVGEPLHPGNLPQSTTSFWKRNVSRPDTRPFFPFECPRASAISFSRKSILAVLGVERAWCLEEHEMGSTHSKNLAEERYTVEGTGGLESVDGSGARTVAFVAPALSPLPHRGVNQGSTGGMVACSRRSHKKPLAVAVAVAAAPRNTEASTSVTSTNRSGWRWSLPWGRFGTGAADVSGAQTNAQAAAAGPAIPKAGHPGAPNGKAAVIRDLLLEWVDYNRTLHRCEAEAPATSDPACTYLFSGHRLMNRLRALRARSRQHSPPTAAEVPPDSIASPPGEELDYFADDDFEPVFQDVSLVDYLSNIPLMLTTNTPQGRLLQRQLRAAHYRVRRIVRDSLRALQTSLPLVLARQMQTHLHQCAVSIQALGTAKVDWHAHPLRAHTGTCDDGDDDGDGDASSPSSAERVVGHMLRRLSYTALANLPGWKRDLTINH